MEQGTKRPGSITFLLVGLVLLVSVGGIAFFAPIFECPGLAHSVETQCYFCKGNGRITAFQRWRTGGNLVETWEGKEISEIETMGFRKTSAQNCFALTGLRKGQQITDARQRRACQQLLAEGCFESVEIYVLEHTPPTDKVTVALCVIEK